MKNETEKKKLLEKILRTYRHDLDEEYRALLSEELTQIEIFGKKIYETLEKLTENEKILYLGSLIETEHIRQNLAYLARQPKAVGPVHESRAKRP